MGISRDEFEREIKRLEKKLCCKTRYYDTFEDFPETGESNILYVDEETGTIYIWNGSTYITYTVEAVNGLRVEGSQIMLGSDSQLDPKDSELISDTYIHLDSYSNSWIGDSSGDEFELKIDSDTTIAKITPDKTGETYVNRVLEIQALSDKDVSFNFDVATTYIPATGINNDVFMLGWNLQGGGGADFSGKTAIGLSFENNYVPSAGDDIAEHHTFFVDKLGVQHRLQSYTIDKDTPSTWEVYQTVNKWYLKDTTTGGQYLTIELSGTNSAIKMLDPTGSSGAEIASNPSQMLLSIVPNGYATGSSIWQNQLNLTGWGDLNTSPFEAVKFSSVVHFNFKSPLRVFADNAAAIVGGVNVNELYQTATGQVMIRY